MKQLTTILLSLLSLPVFAQNTATLAEPKIDRNVELLSIVFRLTGTQEYSDTRFKLYTDRIEDHFGEHRDHEMVRFAQAIRAENSISYDAVMSIAVHLDENLDLRGDVTESSLERRWAGVDKKRFVELLKQFAADTRFDDFFAANRDLYTEASRRFMPVYEALDLEWFSRFFGTEPREKYVIINGLGNGGYNYGFAVEYTDGRREIYSVMGAWSVDEEGMAVFSTEDYLPTLVHEFCHSFVNPLTDKYKDMFRKAGETLFAAVEEQMRNQAYSTWEYMMNEALIRAAVIKYMYDHGMEQSAINAQARSEIARGFGWIGELFKGLVRYDSQRDTYLTFDDFMPRLAEAYEIWTKEL